MLNKITLFFILVSSLSGFGQGHQEISTGNGYNKQSFVKLSENTQKQVPNDAWDLAFTAFGVQDAGIFINESSGSSMGQNLPQTELYYANTDDFYTSLTALDLNIISAKKYLNTEKSWSYGAFNELRDTLNPFDYGWGKYVPSSNKVIGDKLYILKLRNGSYKKIKIESLSGTTYILKYANLDNSDEVTKSLNKNTDNKGQKFIFFSFTTNETVDVLPAGGFDLMYCRYIAIAVDPNGTIVQQYNVTGILTGPGVKTAIADGVDPVSVSYSDYKDKLSSRTDVIGYDWKTLTGTSWALDQDRVFFVKTADNHLWKLQIIDFEGSSTGTAVLEKTDLGVSATSDLLNVKANVYPNPANAEVMVSLDIAPQNNSDLRLEVSDINGQVLMNTNVKNAEGFQVLQINTNDWNKGVYLLRIYNTDQQSVTRKIVKI
ncbi:MAG: T9SS type A sorting domain-containing protein [Saprospiraceae bacterium]|nr:T9SS type A sorting domain-containing protein [Saprospiraceae bacterium]